MELSSKQVRPHSQPFYSHIIFASPLFSLPSFMPPAFSHVHNVARDILFFYPQFIHLFNHTLSLSLSLFSCSSLSPSCLIIWGSGVSVDTSTPITASINLQQCLTCVCVSVCACSLVFFRGCLEVVFRNLLNCRRVRADPQSLIPKKNLTHIERFLILWFVPCVCSRFWHIKWVL